MPDTHKPVRTLPLVVVMTVALVGTLAVAGSFLVFALDQAYSAQLRVGQENEARRQADYLKETFSRMLWNFDLAEIEAVAGSVTRSDAVLGLSIVTDEGKEIYNESKPGQAFLTITSPLSFQLANLGTMTLTMSAQAFELQRATVLVVALEAFLGLLILLLLLAPLMLNRTLLRPFNRLALALVQDKEGEPFPFLPPPSSRITEVRTLELALAKLNDAVARQVNELETRVRARSRELEEAQAMLVRTETLATLGQLAAGIAHELNTPLAAITSSVRLLQTEWEEVLLPLFAGQLSTPGRESAGYLRELSLLAANLEDFPDASVRREMRRRWTELGQDPDAPFFDIVSSTGLSSRLEELAAFPSGSELHRVLAYTADWVRSLAIIGSASQKSAAVVAALRTQVQPGNAQEPKPLELRREVDQALALLQNKLREGVQVEMRSPDPVWALGDSTELSKVWLNLTLNAVQALGGTGKLEIGIHREGTWAVVDVTDSGPGIPPSLRERIFEPFFTTKSTGMGLGLDITRKVVEQNQGLIEFDSVPGRTTFRVRLPAFEHQE